MARLAPLVCVLAVLAPATADAATRAPVHPAQTSLGRVLARAMANTGSSSGAYVMDANSDATLFAYRENTPRSLASNTKLFTSAAVLGRYGAGSTIATSLLGEGSLSPTGVWRGDLYLRGGGDPTFGSRPFARRAYGSDATVDALADQLEAAGFTSVTGFVAGDESMFDSLRGGPDSGYRTSIYVGPLSALDLDRGLANSAGTAFQSNPPKFAAAKLDAALAARGIKVRRDPRAATTPGGAVTLAEVRSPNVARLLRLQNKQSDNLFAELLSKGLPAVPRAGGSLRRASSPPPVTPTPAAPAAAPATIGTARGTTGGGAAAATSYARSLGVKVRLVDGSGLSRSDRAAPRQVALLLDRLRDQRGFSKLYASLPVAGRDGTLVHRMRSGPARGRCHAKTGTLTGVSSLSGYCTSRSGRTLVFSVLVNHGDIYAAHVAQDRVAQALAGYRG